MSEIQGNGPTWADYQAAEADRTRAEVRDLKARLERLERSTDPNNVNHPTADGLLKVTVMRTGSVEPGMVVACVNHGMKDIYLRPPATPPASEPVAIVGDPGWVPASPTGKVTTTELVAALQRRYPDDPEVRALIAKVTASGDHVRQAGDRAAKAESEAADLRRRLAAAEASAGIHDVYAVYGTDANGRSAEIRAVRRERPPEGEVNRDWLIVEKCKAVRDADGRLCLLSPVPVDVDDEADQ